MTLILPTIGIQTPRLESEVRAEYNDAGYEAIELAEAYGLNLDDWQKHVLINSLGEKEDGTWAASRVGLSVPRQNGKGGIFEARHLYGLVVSEEKVLIHSAHEVKSALEAYHRIVSYLENFDDLRKLVKKVSKSRGSEEVVMKDGTTLKFFARTNGIRGFSVDALFLDEAQHIPESAFSAMLPTMAARPNPQIWFVGTPPSEDQDGAVFERQRNAGLSGSLTHYWAEWSADPDLSHDDIYALMQANPAMGIRLREDFAEAERADMTDAAYGRERLGKWDNAKTQYVISPEQWSALLKDINPDEIGNVSLGVDTSPDRTTTCVSIAGYIEDLDDALQPVQRSFVASTAHRDGVGWAVEYITARYARGDVKTVVIDSVGAAKSLIEPLRMRGVEVTVIGMNNYTAACGSFYDAVNDNMLRHAGQPALATSVAGARKRKLGDAWAWTRANSSSDVTPLVSSTLALWGLQSVEKPKTKRKKTKQASTRFYSFS